MARNGIWLSLLSVVFFSSLINAFAEEEYVLTLTAENFDEEIEKHDFVVVEFYAPWCGHCKNLAPEYEKAAKKLKEEGSDIVLAKVDADDSKNKALASKFKVQGFPTLKIFRKGSDEPEEYNGPREAEGIVSHVKALTGPPSKEVKTKEEVEALSGGDNAVVVGVFKDLESEEFKTFESAANVLRTSYIFAHTTDASIISKGPPISAPAVRLFKDFDEGYSDSTVFTLSSLKSFLQTESIPSVVEMSSDPKHRPLLQKVFEITHNKSLLFFAYDIDEADALRTEYTRLAKAAPTGTINCIIGEASQNSHALKYFGLTEEDTPVVVIHDPNTDAKYIKKKVLAAELAAFFEGFEAGKLERTIKSEPIPESNDGPVKILVAHNFKEIVLDSGKNVLIEFYAPWCGHCQKLEPIYNQVGKAFADDEDVIIAKLDYTANDLPTDKFSVKGFPTLYFVTAKGDVLTYDGDRTKDDLIQFVKDSKTESAEEKELAAEAEETAAEEGATIERDEL